MSKIILLIAGLAVGYLLSVLIINIAQISINSIFLTSYNYNVWAIASLWLIFELVFLGGATKLMELLK